MITLEDFANAKFKPLSGDQVWISLEYQDTSIVWEYVAWYGKIGGHKKKILTIEDLRSFMDLVAVLGGACKI